MHRHGAITPSHRLSDIYLLTEQTANRMSNRSVNLLLLVTPSSRTEEVGMHIDLMLPMWTTQRQNQNFMHAHLFHSTTLLASHSAITAFRHSLSATHSLAEQTARSTSDKSARSHLATLSFQVQESKMLI